MQDKMNRILAISYYHALVAGGGHRPHQILLEDLRQGREAVFISSSPTGLEAMQSIHGHGIYEKLAAYHLDSSDGQRLVPLTAHAMALLRQHPTTNHLINDWRPTYVRAHNPVAAFIPFIESLKSAGVPFVYDQMDMWSAFATHPWGAASNTESRYMELADAMTTISKFLLERAPKHLKTHLIANAISSHFLEASANGNGYEPPRRDNSTKHILYMGAIWPDWFNWDLIFKLVIERPQYEFTFIGATSASVDEDDGRQPHKLAARLAKYPNVKLIGEIPHLALLPWLRKANIGLIPFLVNDLTLACSPLKVFEYIGAGLRVAATDLPEIQDYPMVTTCADHAGMLACLDAANDGDEVSRKAAKAFISDNTWSHRLARLDELVGELL